MRRKKNIKERETRVKMLVAQSCLTVTPWTVAHQPSLSMELSKQEYWSGLPFPSPGDPPDPEIEPGSPALQAVSLLSEPPGKPHTFLRPHGLWSTRLLHPWDFPGKNTGVGCHFLHQGIFQTQVTNPGLLHCRQFLYHDGSFQRIP